MSKLNWKTTHNAIIDMPVQSVDQRTGNSETKNEWLLDAYSQWKLSEKHGLLYDLANQKRLEELNDNIILSRIYDLGDAGNAGTISFELPTIVSVNRFLSRERPQAITKTPNVNEDLNTDRSKVDPCEAYGDVWAALPIRESSVSTGLSDEPAKEYLVPSTLKAEKVVIIGVIDDAINVAQPCFEDVHKSSRFEYLWVQDAEAQPLNDAGRSMTYVPYGREWNRSDIDAARQRHNTNDEAIWRDLQMIADGDNYRQSTLRLRRSHGTHVADLAGGENADKRKLLNRRLIAVQLPVLATQDTSGAALIAVVRDAAVFIYERALRMSKALKYPIPVILNISYGIAGGARDGQHLLERSLAKMAKDYRKKVSALVEIPENRRLPAPAITVLPAGNGHLSRGHANSNSNSLPVRLQLQPQDETSSHVEIWFPANTPSIKIAITSPSGEIYTVEFPDLVPGVGSDAFKRKAGILEAEREVGTISVCRVTIDEPHNTVMSLLPQLYWRVLVSFAPTLNPDGLPVAEHGEWKVESNIPQGMGPISAWIARDESLAGFPNLGRQAYFINDLYERNMFDELGDTAVSQTPESFQIDRDLTVSGIATVAPILLPEDVFTHPVMVAANFWDNRHATAYSAAAGGIGGTEFVEAPVVSASSDHSRNLLGLLASGSRGGSIVPQNGTSVAVPQVVRWLADSLEALSPLDRSQFDANNVLMETFGSEAQQPPRPSAARPERITRPEIRKERLRGGFLSEGHAGIAGVDRNTISKI